MCCRLAEMRAWAEKYHLGIRQVLGLLKSSQWFCDHTWALLKHHHHHHHHLPDDDDESSGYYYRKDESPVTPDENKSNILTVK